MASFNENPLLTLSSPLKTKYHWVRTPLVATETGWDTLNFPQTGVLTNAVFINDQAVEEGGFNASVETPSGAYFSLGTDSTYAAGTTIQLTNGNKAPWQYELLYFENNGIVGLTLSFFNGTDSSFSGEFMATVQQLQFLPWLLTWSEYISS